MLCAFLGALPPLTYSERGEALQPFPVLRSSRGCRRCKPVTRRIAQTLLQRLGQRMVSGRKEYKISPGSRSK